MPEWLKIVVFVLALLAVALVRDHWRSTTVKAWVGSRQATLHWPVDLARHPALPAAEIVALIESPGSRRWASAVEGLVDGRGAWVIEYEATHRAFMSSRWYSLCLIETRSPAQAQAMLEARRRAGQDRLATAGAWFAERREGLVKVGLLDEWFRDRVAAD